MLKIKYLIFGFSLIIVSAVFLMPHQLIASSTSINSVSTVALIELTNIERVQNGLPKLKESTLLNLVAKLKAEDMVKNGYFSHNSITGKDSWYWFRKVGYKYLNAGENLAVLFNNSEDVVNAWMNSPSHRANILQPKYSEIGMAVVKGTYNGVETSYVVEVFGNPDNSKPKVGVTPKIKKKATVRVVPQVKTTLVYRN